MSLVTGGLGDTSSSGIVSFSIVVINQTFSIKKQTKKFNTSIPTIKFTVKEVE